VKHVLAAEAAPLSLGLTTEACGGSSRSEPGWRRSSMAVRLCVCERERETGSCNASISLLEILALHLT
jgi:hypothetical protein